MAIREDEIAVRMATAELIAIADVFRRLTDSCWIKCIPTIKEPSLNPGEASCIDRCVGKYQDAQVFVGTELQSVMAANQQQTT